MKRVFSLILALALLFGSVTVASAAAPGGKYARAQQEQDASAAFMTGVFCALLGRMIPEAPEEEITLSERAVYWGLPEDIRWIEKPQTNEDIESNILYSFLTGTYHFRFDNLTPEQGDWLFGQIASKDGAKPYIKRLACSYPELAGALANVFTGCGNYVQADGDGYFFIDFPQLKKTEITDELLYQQ